MPPERETVPAHRKAKPHNAQKAVCGRAIARARPGRKRRKPPRDANRKGCADMAEWKRKLHSQSGASLLFALLFFLVAAMVSIVALDAAVTTVKRLTDDVHWEQDYLSLASAARLFRQALADSSCTLTIVTEYTGGGEGTDAAPGEPSYSVSADGPLSGPSEEQEGPLEYMISSFFQKETFNTDPPAPPKTETFTISAGEGLRDVDVQWTMDGYSSTISHSFQIKAVFQCEDDGWTRQKLYLTADADIATTGPMTAPSDTDANDYTVTTQYLVTWKEETIRLSVNTRNQEADP